LGKAPNTKTIQGHRKGDLQRGRKPATEVAATNEIAAAKKMGMGGGVSFDKSAARL